MSDVAVIGGGYVGAVSAACLAELGHSVLCIDIDAARVAHLSAGRSPIHEAGLEELLQKGLAAGRLSFTSVYPPLIEAGTVFLAVNTPGSQGGAADLRAVRDAVGTLATRVADGTVVVNKSTVPIGTGELVEGMAAQAGRRIAVVSNPEFLREGSAVQDFMNPDRIVLGSADAEAIERVARLYEPLDAPILRVDVRTAEMIKYASNAFLATKISFINEIAAICDSVGADIEAVAHGMGMDSRIGASFLRAGLGWGGSCFPKDVRALAHIAAIHGAHPQLLRSVVEINDYQRLLALQKLRAELGSLEGRKVLVLGAAFKAGTDDIRNSPALELAQMLVLEGASVAVYDPVVSRTQISRAAPAVLPVETPLDGADGAHAIVVATDWPEFRDLPLGSIGARMASRLIVDARNIIDPHSAHEAGFVLRCHGRPAAERGSASRNTVPEVFAV